MFTRRDITIFEQNLYTKLFKPIASTVEGVNTAAKSGLIAINNTAKSVLNSVFGKFDCKYLNKFFIVCENILGCESTT
jgi:hypothetical protein